MIRGALIGVVAALLLAAPAAAQTVPIHDVQGPGAASPIVGANVTVPGIVTAVTSDGFFLQTPDAVVDADPATSQGIFVVASSAPAAVVGCQCSVTGTVSEFVPGTDAHLLNPPVRPGDVISLPPAGNVQVDGWVQKPGSYQLTRGLTLMGALAAAGGRSSHRTGSHSP